MAAPSQVLIALQGLDLTGNESRSGTGRYSLKFTNCRGWLIFISLMKEMAV